jgi:hypothetical protein
MVPTVLVRRVNRVRARMSPGDEAADEILDDLFVLWRAFEWAYAQADGGGQAQRAQTAIVGVIEYAGMAALPATQALIRAFKYFQRASEEELAEWFRRADAPEAYSTEAVLHRLTVLRDAVSPTLRWSERDSRVLGDLLYRMRCAVIHPRLDTNNVLLPRVLPALRECIIELVIARAAEMTSMPPAEARRVFDRAGL